MASRRPRPQRRPRPLRTPRPRHRERTTEGRRFDHARHVPAQHLAPKKRRQVRATTAYRYSWFVDRYINPAIGDVPLRRLRVDHLDTLYLDLATTGGRHGTGLAAKTVLEVHMIIRAALEAAADRHLVDRNVAHAAHARLARSRATTARAWTAAELATFLDNARSQRLYPALHLTAYTGMRRGEVVGLKWSDLDVAAKRLPIVRTVQCVGGQPVEFGVKTRTSRRCIDLDEGSVRELRRWRRRLGRDGLPCGGDDWMFCNAGSRFLNPESVSQLFTRTGFAAGVPIKVVSERLGHSHPGFTMKTYQHVMPGMSAAAAEQFAALITDATR